MTWDCFSSLFPFFFFAESGKKGRSDGKERKREREGERPPCKETGERGNFPQEKGFSLGCLAVSGRRAPGLEPKSRLK